MLKRTPLLNWPAVSTTGVAAMLTWRAIRLWLASRICAPTVIGSTPSQGREPWVCLPRTVRLHSSALASIGPLR